MKIYRLKSWPDLPPAFKRMAYRRVLCDLSHRHIGEAEMREHCGLSGAEIRQLLTHLESQGLLDTLDAPDPAKPPSARARLGWLASPLHHLLRRAS